MASIIQDLVMEFLKQEQNHDKNHKQFFIVKKRKEKRKQTSCVLFIYFCFAAHYKTATGICIRFHLLSLNKDFKNCILFFFNFLFKL